MKIKKFDVFMICIIILYAIIYFNENSKECKSNVVSEVPVNAPVIDSAYCEAVSSNSVEDNESEVKEDIDSDLCIHASPTMRNGHMCVDLGTSVLWATCNVGSNNIPTSKGDFFSFGEVKPRKGTYSSIEYKKNRRVNYDTLPNKHLMLQDDPAYVFWGGNWRTPTLSEVDELIDNCNYRWVKNYMNSGVEGCLISCRCKKNPKSIFIPVNGIFEVDSVEIQHSGIMNRNGVNLWTSSLDFNEHSWAREGEKSCYYVSIYDNDKDVYFNSLCSVLPYFSMPIRPVINKLHSPWRY